MREKSRTMGRTGIQRLLAASTGVGAIAVVAIFALSSVASAGIANMAKFPGAYSKVSNNRHQQFCARFQRGSTPHWSAKSGAGGMNASASAKTCKEAKGGVISGHAVDSFAQLDPTIKVFVPVKLGNGVGGLNVTWNIHATLLSHFAFDPSNYSCPVTESTNDSWLGNTWYNQSYTVGFCWADSQWNIGVGAELIDTTTGVVTNASHPLALWWNETTTENQTYIVTKTYSNSSYWANNYSYSLFYNDTYSYSWNATGYWDDGNKTLLSSLSETPQFFLNGTFSASDSYLLYTYVYDLTGVGFQWPGATAAGLYTLSTSMQGGNNHADLQPLVVW
jgi:hypothetical protein